MVDTQLLQGPGCADAKLPIARDGLQAAREGQHGCQRLDARQEGTHPMLEDGSFGLACGKPALAQAKAARNHMLVAD